MSCLVQLLSVNDVVSLEGSIHLVAFNTYSKPSLHFHYC